MRHDLASTLVSLVANAHLWHFYTKNYSAHKAFGDFYTGLQGLADSYIEADIGAHGPLEYTSKSFNYTGVHTSVQTIRNFKDHIKVVRDAQEGLGQNGLVAKLEEIMTLCDTTLYKLENLS